MTETDFRTLMEEAIAARKNAYAPYSGFRVGAALQTADGEIFRGCNIENAAFSPTICAERTAFAKAISEGKREFTAIAIAGGKGEKPDPVCAPCGVCRQIMAEFCAPDFQIILGTPGALQITSLEALLPLSFSKDGLK